MAADGPIFGCELDPLWNDCIDHPCEVCPYGPCEGNCGEDRQNCMCPPDDEDDYDDAPAHPSGARDEEGE